MPITITLPDNQTATLKTSEELSNKDAKVIRRAGSKVAVTVQKLRDNGLDDARSEDDATDEELAAANQKALTVFSNLTDAENDDLDIFQRTCAAIRLIEWTLDLPLPKTPEDVDNLPRPIYIPLVAAAQDIDLNDSFDKETGLLDPTQGTTELSDSSLSLVEDSP